MKILNSQKLTKKRFYRVQTLGQEWNEQLLDIAFESPVKSGGFHIIFDRSPNIFTIPFLTSESFLCGGLFKGEELLGYAIATFQRRYTGHHRVSNVMYLGNMHVTNYGRRSGFFYRMSDFFFGKHPNDIEYYYAYVMEHNEPAMKLVNRRHPRFPNAPYAKIVGQISMVNIFMTIPVRINPNYSIRAATHDDVNHIVELLQNEYSTRFLAPEMDRAIFLRNLERRPNFGIENYLVALSGTEIVGVCSAWDMTPFKKNRVMNYGRALRLTRFLYNTSAPLLGMAPLPKDGESLKDVTIAEYAVKKRDPNIMNALLRFVYMQYREREYHSIIFGSSVDDPLLSAVKSFYRKEFRSNVIIGSKQRDKIEGKDMIPMIYADSIQI